MKLYLGAVNCIPFGWQGYSWHTLNSCFLSKCAKFGVTSNLQIVSL